MLRFDAPSIDENNPLYCPSVTPASYLESLRHKRRDLSTRSRGKTSRNDRFQHSFALILEKALVTDALDSSDDELDHGERVFKRPRTISNSSDESLPAYSYPIPAWELEDEQKQEFWDSVAPGSPGGCEKPMHKKQRRGCFTELHGPPKYERSGHSVQDSSFDVVVKHETLSYSAAPASVVKPRTPIAAGAGTGNNGDTFFLTQRIHILEDELYGPRIGTESPRGLQSFIEVLERVLPGIRLKERLAQLSMLSHQSIVDFLGAHGYLNARVLAIFRTSEIRWITLTESLAKENGLNLCGDILPIFSRPNSFVFLTELSLRDTCVNDFDLTYIQRLPKLSTLLLDNCTLSNEAVFLLVPLKHTLTQLSIGSNPRINDDAVPALLLLAKLTFLSILDTGIQMHGLRRLARTIYDDDRIIDIEIPIACEDYVDHLQNKYALDPRPPLITDPDACRLLSIEALQRNLAAHAARNSNIIATGGKVEMAERLRNILEMRAADMLVRDMILGEDSAEG
ncbi:hypothetical protein DXG03_001579 [Asterophora parasitica]|uniref:Uncharacterized protein n=1 Tax=Asterophora parasitica TaxID=117018 RepID=A0A9P7G573_9AGAR|nr:hypothetical protein DXG03_001579 [Asterophora parasitica]